MMKRSKPLKRRQPGRVRRLVMMVKEPRAGKVKTRLARGIGVGQATYFYRHTVSALLARLGSDPRWETWVSISPDGEVASRFWPRGIRRARQGGGDLGARMQRVFDWTYHGPSVIIGTDIPNITCADIAAAFSALGRDDAVIGPAPDGGYWLVGARRFPRLVRPFADVRWSTAYARADTMRNLRDRRVSELRAIVDVDTVDEWRVVNAWAGRRVLPLEVRG